MTWNCENCGAQLEEGVKFCPNCGTRINWEQSLAEGSFTCENCGGEFNGKVGFCPHCGAKINRGAYKTEKLTKKQIIVLLVSFVLFLIGSICAFYGTYRLPILLYVVVILAPLLPFAVWLYSDEIQNQGNVKLEDFVNFIKYVAILYLIITSSVAIYKFIVTQNNTTDKIIKTTEQKQERNKKAETQKKEEQKPQKSKREEDISLLEGEEKEIATAGYNKGTLFGAAGALNEEFSAAHVLSENIDGLGDKFQQVIVEMAGNEYDRVYGTPSNTREEKLKKLYIKYFIRGLNETMKEMGV